MLLNHPWVVSLFIIGGVVAGCGASEHADPAAAEQGATEEERSLVNEPLGELEQPLGEGCGGIFGVSCTAGEVCEIAEDCPPEVLSLCVGTCVTPPDTYPCIFPICAPGSVCIGTGSIAHCVPSL